MKIFPSLAIALAVLFGSASLAQSTYTARLPRIAAQLTPSLHGRVIVPVVVHNKKGHLISNLTAADFTLTDNTHPQTIHSFAPNTSLPLTVGILAQTGSGMGTQLSRLRRSAEATLAHLLTSAHTQAFVIQFNRDVDLLEDPSPSIAKLHQALHQLGMPQFNGDSNGTVATGAALYDSIYLASSQVLDKEPGRKTLILFSDGIDRNSKATLNSAIQAAQTAGVTVYAIYYKNEASSKVNRQTDGEKVLAEICNRTGGKLFDSKRASLDSLLAQIADQLNNAYILEYTRTAAADDSGFHHIVLKPKQKNLWVQITKGYWLPQ